MPRLYCQNCGNLMTLSADGSVYECTVPNCKTKLINLKKLNSHINDVMWGRGDMKKLTFLRNPKGDIYGCQFGTEPETLCRHCIFTC